MRKILYFYARECPPCKFYKKQFIEPLEQLAGKEKIQHINDIEELLDYLQKE